MREFRIATSKSSPIHNDVLESTTLVLFDQPSVEANTSGTQANTRGKLITKTEEDTINAKTANLESNIHISTPKLPSNKVDYIFYPSLNQNDTKKIHK